jgi:hypothetical protein
MRRLVIGLVGVGSLVVVLAGPAVAQGRKPDATLNLSSESVAAWIGVSWGNGTLSYNGKTYAVKIEGLSVGEAGVTRATAKADVYNLVKVEDFSGNYAAVSAGATVGGGGGVTVLRNQHGVVIELLSTTQGASVMLGVEGIRLTLAN